MIGVSECMWDEALPAWCIWDKASRNEEVSGCVYGRSNTQGWGVGDAVNLRKHVPPAADVQRPHKLAQHFESARASFAQTRQHVAVAAPPRHR